MTIDDDDLWIEVGRAEIERLLETLELNPVSNEAGVVIPVWYERDPVVWFASLDAMKDAIIDYGDSVTSDQLPTQLDHDGLVFEIDTSDVVDEVLDACGVVSFFESLEAPRNESVDHIFVPGDYAAPSAGLVFRVDIADINAELIGYLARNPKKMHELSPRKFEKLVAELLKAKGYDIALTASSGDGGKDIICTQKTALGTMLIHVECKRYAPERPVGVEVVRSLYGVVESDGATQGVVATTSRFTSGARAFHERNKYRLALQDFEALSGWLRDYRTHR